MKAVLSLALLVGTLSSSSYLSAVPTKNLGEEIAFRSYNQMSGFSDMKAKVSMLTERDHKTTEDMSFLFFAREVGRDQLQRLTIMEKPSDLKGMKFLNYSFDDEEDQQWMYIPKLKRVKRMPNQGRSANFMGSEFSYEDISTPRPTKFSYEFQGEGKVDGRDSYAVVRRPNFEGSNYSYNVVWFDQENYLTQKIDFYDKKGELVKELTFNRYRKDDNHPWQALEMVMRNKSSGDISKMLWENLQYGTGLKDSLFSAARLDKVYLEDESKNISEVKPTLN